MTTGSGTAMELSQSQTAAAESEPEEDPAGLVRIDEDLGSRGVLAG
jgi:hypothetical protein